MDYRLHYQGQDLGAFPLEELRRRRMAGQLTGSEYVWREGLADWQTLDAVLQASGAPPEPRPPPLPAHAHKRKKTGTKVAASVAVALGVLAGVAALWFKVAEVRKRVIEVIEAQKARSGGGAS